MPWNPKRYLMARSRRLPWAVVGLALFILAGTIAYAAYALREQSRAQIVNQHAQILYALWQSQRLDDSLEPLLDASERASDLLPSVLQTALLPLEMGIYGTRLFDAHGKYVYAAPNLSEGRLPPGQLPELRALRPVARLRESVEPSEVTLIPPEEPPTTLLEVAIPLHSSARKELIGVAQFVLDGTKVAAEFDQLDRNLFKQAALTFLVAGGLLATFISLAFRMLQVSNRLLEQRTQDLLKANQELALAARISAVGAVTSHLIHGLKNPLSGLQTFVASRGAGGEPGADSDWQLAVSSTRRMQNMISEIVRVLQDEGTESQYELSLEEFSGMLNSKVQPLAREAGVSFESACEGQGSLGNREANILSLVLYNLIHNAIQATPRGKLVAVNLRASGRQIVCEVADQGSGFPEAQRANLFKPCHSRKEGGSGIGLAISKQLANSLGAELELKETGPGGSRFVLAFTHGSGTEEDREEATCGRA
jgi:signal transduction histidine kinase